MRTWFVYIDAMNESEVRVVTKRLEAENRYTHFKGSS
jgi:hypothetical protein